MSAGDRLAGRFLVEREVGRGGSGVVFAARDEHLGRTVALKVLRADTLDSRQIERLRREVRAGVGHPNLVSIYELYEADGKTFLSMELVDGVSLRDRLSRGRTLDEVEVREIGRQVAAALVELHGRGLVHRDVKPGNVLLTQDRTVKLADLGLVRPVLGNATVTETAMVVGTPAYMAPEQAMGGELGPGIDVYGLGLLLFRCLTGGVPHVGDSALDTLMKRQRARPPRISRAGVECEPWFERLIRRMLEPDPRERSSAEEVVEALDKRSIRPRIRWRQALGVAAAVFVVVAIVLGVDLLQTRDAAAFAANGRAVCGVDEKGEEVWRHELSQPVVQRVLADVTGDGNDEVIVVAEPQERTLERTERRSVVMVFDRRGRMVTRAQPGDLVRRWTYPYPHVLEARARTGDLNGDGAVEVVVAGHHPRFFPSAVLVYWPDQDVWDDVLHHPGWITSLVAGRNSTTGTIRFAGVNNRLCKLTVLAELGVLSPRQDSAMTWDGGAGWPGVENTLDEQRRVHWRSYTLLPGTSGLPTRLVFSDDGGILLRCKQSELRLDEWDNPVPGPNAGLDLRKRRLQFVRALDGLKTARQPLEANNVAELVERIRRAAGPLMQEPPYRIALAERGGRALARAGSLDAAVDMVADAFEDTGTPELEYRLCHLLALQGRLMDAAARTRKLVGSDRGERYDGSLLLVWLGTIMHRPDLVRDGQSRIGSGQRSDAASDELMSTLEARVHLWWDELGPEDCEVRTLDFEPAGDALACLARWRLGRTHEDDPEKMEQLIRATPDAIAEARLALAAAYLGLDQPEHALTPLSTTEARLEVGLGDDFVAQKLLDLTYAMRVVVLMRLDKVEEARALADKIRPHLDPRLLPGILVAEALNQN